MQTGDITKQWMPENCGKFNRGVGKTETLFFILSIIIILIVTSATFQSFPLVVIIIMGRLTYKVIGFILFWWYLQ